MFKSPSCKGDVILQMRKVIYRVKQPAQELVQVFYSTNPQNPIHILHPNSPV